MNLSIRTPDTGHYPMSHGGASAKAVSGGLRLRWRDRVGGRFRRVWLSDGAAGVEGET